MKAVIFVFSVLLIPRRVPLSSNVLYSVWLHRAEHHHQKEQHHKVALSRSRPRPLTDIQLMSVCVLITDSFPPENRCDHNCNCNCFWWALSVSMSVFACLSISQRLTPFPSHLSVVVIRPSSDWRSSSPHWAYSSPQNTLLIYHSTRPLFCVFVKRKDQPKYRFRERLNQLTKELHSFKNVPSDRLRQRQHNFWHWVSAPTSLSSPPHLPLCLW